MLYLNGQVARPCLDVNRQDLRDYLQRRHLDAQADESVVLLTDASGALWREDATNAHTDRFRAFVRNAIVPLARQRNPRHAETLCRSMNLIADEDDMLIQMTGELLAHSCTWLFPDEAQSEAARPEAAQPEPVRIDAPPSRQPSACLLGPDFARSPLPLQRRAAAFVLKAFLDEDARIETASVDAITSAYRDGAPISGYTANIQGNLALSANKKGLRIEPMEHYRARRKGAR